MNIIKKDFFPHCYRVECLAENEDDGVRFDTFLKILLPNLSREKIRQIILKKNAYITGRPGVNKPSTYVRNKDEIILQIFEDSQEKEFWRGREIELERIPQEIFKDDNLIVCNKPAFMATHPTGKHLFNCVTVYYQNLLNKMVHSIHRIDRETSGILLLATNPKTANEITELFEKNFVKKCYFLIGVKTSRTKIDCIEDCICARERLLGDREGLKKVYINHYDQNSENGKVAFTKFVKLYEDQKYILSLAFPKTGRQHQIRVHALVHGFPLLGDKLYLGNYKMFQRFKDHMANSEDCDLMQIPRHALHALSISFFYNGKQKVFTSSLPNDLKDFIQKNINWDFDTEFLKIKQIIINNFN